MDGIISDDTEALEHFGPRARSVRRGSHAHAAPRLPQERGALHFQRLEMAAGSLFIPFHNRADPHRRVPRLHVSDQHAPSATGTRRNKTSPSVTAHSFR